MLFIQSNSLALSPNEAERLRLLDALAARGFNPVVRAARRLFFQSLVAQGRDAAFVAAAAAELERECAARHQAEGKDAYTPGELFCAGDCVLSLLFRGGAEEGVSAGVIYSADTREPLAKLERFCRDVRGALAEIKEEERGAEAAAEPATELPDWQARAGRSPLGLARFMATQPADFVRAAAALRGGRELTRASELMEEQAVRSFLRRVQEMRREGFTPRRLFREAGGVPVETMLDAGLLEREVRVSCRKSGHALFDLPSPDSLAAVTLSRAKCSQCASPVADEVIEETINPTRLAVSLLEDGRWLSNRVYAIIRSLGVPESEIATGPASAHGESHLAVDVCGNSFLFVTRDGDLTPALCRRVVEVVEETEATHLVVVVNGAVEDEGQLRLYEFAWRRARGGRDLDLTVVEGLGGARPVIERSFERAVHRRLTRDLFALDAALGFSAGNFVLGWFKLSKAAGAKQRDDDARAPLHDGLQHQVAS
jgi:glutathione S-transferase